MCYQTLMVHLDLDEPNHARLKIAGDLAKRFQAGVIGIAACAQTLPLYFTEGWITDELIAQDLADIEKRLKAAEAQFRADMSSRAARIEWRSALTEPTSFVAEQSRAADLIIIGARRADEPVDLRRQMIPGELVTIAGRPVLIVPQDVAALTANRILIAWKDAREARRAVLDALPFLAKCERAIVAEIDESDDPSAAQARVDDVVAWLGHHGVKASGIVQRAIERTADELNALARQEEADLIVAGAYGHSRVREWVLGGVTRDFFTRTPRCCLLAH